MKKIAVEVYKGIQWGCTIFVLVGILMAVFRRDALYAMFDNYVVQAICSMIVGIGFTVPSLIYENDRLSYGMQAFIHLGIGFIIYFPIAFYAQWIPVELGKWAIIASVIAMLFAGIALWFGFYIYYKGEAKKINECISRKTN